MLIEIKKTGDMKTLITLIGIILFSLTTHATEIILACGQNSGTNFNGWYVSPYQTDAIEFDEQSVRFFSENGGEMNIALYRKVGDLSDYENVHLLFNFEGIQNCSLNRVHYAVSSNGRDWVNLANSTNNTNCMIDATHENIQFIKAIASVQFFKNGILVCDYAKLEGDRKEMPITEYEEEKEIQIFHLFSHHKTLNIETKSTRQFDVLITAMSGQIMFRETFTGSQRIDLPEHFTGFYVVTVIQDYDFKLSKKIVL